MENNAKIITAKTISELSKRLNKAVAEGFTPLANPFLGDYGLWSLIVVKK